jgi:transposase
VINNNIGERTLRLCAIGRKNWLFLGKNPGGRIAAMLLSSIASAKANQVETWASPRAAISALAVQRRGTIPLGALLPSSLPDAYLATHPDVHRPRSR